MATVRKRGDRWQIDYFDPSGKRIRVNFKKKRDAEAELAKRVSLIAEGRYLDVKKDCKITLGELVAKYRENYGTQRSFNGWKRYCIQRWLDHFGSETILTNIRYVNLESYRNKLNRTPTQHGTPRTIATINREMAALHHIFKKAAEWELIEKSPFDSKKSLIAKENNKRFRFLSEDEITQLLDTCPAHLRNIVICAIHSGARKGEILSLKWEQIKNGHIYLGKTKTDESRQIPISDELQAVLDTIRGREQLKSPYVFLYDGKSILDIKVGFNAALKRAGIVGVRFHDLRHTCASHLALRGASLKTIQEILGHKNISTTMRYAHLTQDHVKKAVNLLSGITGTCHKSVTNTKGLTGRNP